MQSALSRLTTPAGLSVSVAAGLQAATQTFAWFYQSAAALGPALQLAGTSGSPAQKTG